MHERKYNTFLCVLLIGFLASIFFCAPIFYDRFIYSKWLVIYSVSIISLIFELVFYKNKEHPITLTFLSHRKLQCGFLIVIVGYVLSAILNLNTSYYGQILDWLCGLQIVRVSFYLSSKDLERTIKGIHYSCVLSIAIIAINILLAIDMSAFYYQNSVLELFFGNRNLLAEFLGASFLVQFFCFRHRHENKYWDFYLLLSLILTIGLIGLTLCRSVWIGCLIATFYFLLSFSQLKNSKRYFTLIFIFIFTIFSYPASKSFYESNNSISKISEKYVHAIQNEKNISIGVRKARWLNTLYMIKDHWFGVGPGNYEFGYVKYHSRWKIDVESAGEVIIKSPHNAYLELLVEGGIVSFFGLMLIIYSLIKEREITTKGYILSVGFFIFFAIDALFAFPLETAVTFFVFCIFFGMYLSSLNFNPHQKMIRGKCKLLLKSIFLLIILSISTISTLSFYLEYNYYFDLNKVSFACNIFPENWRACIRKSELEINNQYFDESIKTLQSLLKRNPNNFVAIDGLGKVYWEKGDLSQACNTIYNFDELFLYKSHLHEFYEINCK